MTEDLNAHNEEEAKRPLAAVPPLTRGPDGRVATEMNWSEFGELHKTDPELADKMLKEKQDAMGIPRTTPPPPPSHAARLDAAYQRQLEEEIIRQRARCEARQLLQDEERSRLYGGMDVTERLLDGESALFDMPEIPDAVWGKGPVVAWAKGQGTMLAGPTGLGKTTTAHNIITRMIGLDETPFLGMEVMPTDNPVLYLAMDRPIQTRQAMRRLVPDTSAARALVKDKFRMWTGPFPFRLLDDPTRLAAWIQDQVPGCRTVFFDSVKDMTPGVSEEASGAAVQIAWQELVAMNVDFMALHHFRKSGQDREVPASINEIYGSTWLTAGLGSVISISGKNGEGNVIYRQHKTVMEQMPDVDAVHHYKTGVIELRDDTPPTVNEALRAAGDTGTTAEQLSVKVYGLHTTALDKKIRRQLNELKKAGKADKLSKPAGAGAATPDLWIWTKPSGDLGNKWSALMDD